VTHRWEGHASPVLRTRSIEQASETSGDKVEATEHVDSGGWSENIRVARTVEKVARYKGRGGF